ncbi:MAG: hypothetical protein J1E80_07765 [Desulfovibrionaceae bacterium]|nr:hypothetical protein [Desulfovibrionaceae bacterium]
MESAPEAPGSDLACPPESESGDPPSDIPLPCPRYAASVFAALPSPDTALWLLLVLAGAAALCWLIRRHEVLRAALTADPWADSRAVDSTLTLAQDHRAVFHLAGRQNATEQPGQSLRAVCAHLERRALVLLSIREMADAAAWVGRPVRVEFSITVGDSPRFFRFDSAVLRVGRDGARCLLELARPARLESYRRRSFPRIRPARSELAAAGLWRLEPCPPASDAESGGAPVQAGPPPDNPARLGAPLLAFRPGAAASLRLDSLSASGVGLRIPRDAAIPERCLLFLCLRTDRASPLALWLDCERRHLTTHPGRTTNLLGLSITRWGRVTRADDIIPWTPAASDGSVPLLLRWTLRRAASLNP